MHTELTRPADLTKIIQEAVFVGIVDLHRCLSLIQHAKRLYLVNHASLACVRPICRSCTSDMA
jgi:DNA mismatch repair protein MLH1